MSEIDIYTDHDSNLRSSQPNNNYGSRTGMIIWKSGVNQWIPILHFITDDIPIGINIISAVLWLYANVGSNATSNPVYKNATMFNENIVTWNNKPSTDGASIGVISSASSGWHTMDITNILTGWYDNSIVNNGIQIPPQSPLVWTQNASYSTKESTDIPSEKPYIKVTYSDLSRPLWTGPHNNLQII